MDPLHSILRSCLRQMLEPIVRFCLKRSIGVQEVLEELKCVYLKVGAQQMRDLGEEINVSRLSAMTGIHRRDVRRIHQRAEIKAAPQGTSSRIIGRWQTDRRFATKPGRPRVLRIDQRTNEFERLVAAVGSDLHPTTVLFELERIGAVKRVRDGVKLTQRAYSARGNSQEALEYLAADVRDLMQSVTENVEQPDSAPHHHGTTVFDAIVPAAEPEIKQWLMQQGSEFHHKVRTYLSRYDSDANPKLRSEKKLRVVFGSFSHIGTAADHSGEESK